MDSCGRRFVRLTEQCANGFFREIRQRFVDTFNATGDGDAVLLAPALVGLAWATVPSATVTISHANPTRADARSTASPSPVALNVSTKPLPELAKEAARALFGQPHE